MRRFAVLPLLALAAPALAHPDHIAESAGHSHWLALAAVAAAVGIAAFGLARAFLGRPQRRAE